MMRRGYSIYDLANNQLSVVCHYCILYLRGCESAFIIPISWLGFVAAVCSLCLICTVLHLHPLESVLQTPIDHALITWKFPLMNHGLCFMWTSCLYQLSRLSVPIEMLVQPLYIYPFNDNNNNNNNIHFHSIENFKIYSLDQLSHFTHHSHHNLFVYSAPSLDSTSQQWPESFIATVDPASLQVIQLYERFFCLQIFLMKGI